MSNELEIQDLIVEYKDYMGTQAQEIVVLKATVAKLLKEIEALKTKTDKVK